MSYRVKLIAGCIAGLVLLGVLAAAVPRFVEWQNNKKNLSESEAPKTPATLVGTDSIRLQEGAIQSLGVTTVAAKTVSKGPVLEFPGSLSPDTDRLLPVRSRFAGEVIAIAEVEAFDRTSATSRHTVSNGDKVKQRQLLAVVWSKDLGEKKSELVDALSKLQVDQENLKRLRDVGLNGVVPERDIRQAERDVAADRIAVDRADLTLRSWRLTNEEMSAIYKEAATVTERVRKGQKAHTPEEENNWARVEVWAPFDGTILEKNITKGAIIDTTTNLFMLGDLTRLNAFAYAYEDELPYLQGLPKPVPWTIHLKADPKATPMPGTISEIRPVIDTTMKAALVRGEVENPQGKLLSGQSIIARVQLPAPVNQVEVPMTALVEDGEESIVFVQANQKEPVYTMRKVAVARRTRETAYIFSTIPPERVAPGVQPLQADEHVVIGGALIMKSALTDLKEALPPKK